MAKQDPIVTDILKWYNHSKYIRIGSDVSVTELMDSPQIVHLRERHRPKLTVTELDDIIPALMGTGLHNVLQSYLRTEANTTGKWLIERKMVSVVDGIRIAGKFDALRDLKHMYDIKTAATWKYIFGGTSDYEKQLNMYDYMMRQDGFNIETLTIFMVFKDWAGGKIWEKGYPQNRQVIIPIKKWDNLLQEAYIKGRVDGWVQAKALPDNKLPKCTPSERWAEKEVFKLYRTKTAKRATKVCETATGAKSYQDVCRTNDKKAWANSYIVPFHPKPWKRCESWCSVKDYCHQYKNKVI